MSNRYIAFDVETPNAANDRMSAIGITVVEKGKIQQEFYTLVNPEAHFDPFNIELTGITPEMVEDAPAFPRLWQEIEPIMNSGLLVAHNAPFDMSVLAKCLAAYEISWHPYAYYACTCQMSRQALPDTPDHKLDTLCRYLKIELNHHNAGSDSRACAELLLHCIAHGANPDAFLRNYDIAHIRTTRPRRYVEPSETAKKLLALQTLLSEITRDGVLSRTEMGNLCEWLTENRSLRGNYPYDKIFFTVERALNDGAFTEAELREMQTLFRQVTDPVANCANSFGICLTGKTYCLTGEFAYGDRARVQARLAAMGGIPLNNVTRKTDFVIVGSRGSDAWCAGTYGTKVKKALEMQEKGLPIQILREEDLCLS